MATLNPEPADPESREKQHLPPKSFADAVQDEVPNGHADSASTTTGDAVSNHKSVNGSGQDDVNVGHGKKAAVLKIVAGNGESNAVDEEKEAGDVDSNPPAAKETQNGDKPTDVEDVESPARPQVERQESKHEYEAAGLDETPRSPPRYKHRKVPSQSKSRSVSTLQSSSSSTAEKGETSQTNKAKTVVFEKEQSGEKLISVRPTEDYEKGLARSKKEGSSKPLGTEKHDKSLVSGRQAGKSWDTSHIRFAPWNVPLKRRLQTLVVLCHTLCIALSVSVFFFLCAIPIFWPLLIPYLIYCMTSKAPTSGELSHRSPFLRSLPVWSLFAGYFPARLHRSAELTPTRKYIFGYHPHGIISMGAFAAFGTEALGFAQLFPGITNTLLTLDSNFRIPIYRDYALAMGLASVSRESCENILTRGGPNGEGMGRAITIVVGGARESLDAKPHTLRLVLKRRYGFIKIAVRTGADLVPVIAFGENDIYEQVLASEHPRIHKFQLLIKKLAGFTIPLFHARGVFNYDVGLMPYRRPLNVVVGRPIKVRFMKEPTQEYLEKLHVDYIAEVERLWDVWKDEFAPRRKEELTLVD